MPQTSRLQDIPFNRIDGTPATLGAFAGSVVLIVNVASKCGLTPQYAGLEALYKAQHARGFEILGFPANNFGDQEPGSNAEISAFCALSYGVSFPMFEKISVKGDDQHPLYRALVAAQPAPKELPASNFRAKLAGHGFTQTHPNDVLWNFEKFVIDRNGNAVARFAPDVTAESDLLLQELDRLLQAS